MHVRRTEYPIVFEAAGVRIENHKQLVAAGRKYAKLSNGFLQMSEPGDIIEALAAAFRKAEHRQEKRR